MEILINVDKNRRIRVYPEGGLDLECWIGGIGWVLDNEADIPDHVIASYLQEAHKAIKTAAAPLGVKLA